MGKIINFIESNREKIIFFVVALELLLLAFFNFFTERVIMHSDTAIQILNTKEILETGDFVPKGWWYSDQVWILGPNLYHLAFTPFVKHAMNLHTMAGLMNFILLFIALYSVMRIIKISRFSSLVVISIIFSGISFITTDDLFGQFVYGVVLTNTFLVFLLLFYFMNKSQDFFLSQEGPEKRKLLLKAVLSGILLFAFNALVSLSGNRYIFTVSLPVILAFAVLFIVQKNRITTVKIFFTSIFLIALSSFLGSYFLTHFIAPTTHLVSKPEMSSFTNIERIDFNITWMFNSFLLFSGAWEQSLEKVNVFSIKGALAFYKFFLFLFIFILPLYLARNFYKIKNLYLRFFLIYTFILAALIGFSTLSFPLLEPGGTSRYYLAVFIPMIVLAGIFIDKVWLKNSNKLLKTTNLSPCWIIILLLPLYLSSYFQFVAPKLGVERHPLQPLTDFLTDHGIKYGYAGHWKSQIITVLSDYNILIRPVIFYESGNIPSRDKILESDRWYSQDYYRGKTALILSQKDYDTINWDSTNERFGLPATEYNFQDNKIFVYDYNIAEKFNK